MEVRVASRQHSLLEMGETRPNLAPALGPTLASSKRPSCDAKLPLAPAARPRVPEVLAGLRRRQMRHVDVDADDSLRRGMFSRATTSTPW
jgi:hypothetical protein